ncbi:Ribonuclease BN, tRNA processing enzyme [Evansella caseinilytica]|uniref:Ribonuclease BN, tRNA processing enzyme n=1 Tax=Evansella caseinilytica TaxID=1503961 RepID=A0A1H3PQZ3_9BACI|nr:MBL fold metallo-hydrolase [Evansella caseinilytica]SDZ03692.1 Ribonuclease BN, tRNA processing enzyme [Evansella caseinilytica]
MKLTVIGFWGAYPGANEATSAYFIEEEETRILLDCGSGAVARLQNHIDLSTLTAAVLTHYHHDHIADIGVLQYSRVVDMNLQRTAEPLKIYGHGDDQPAFQQLGKKPFADAFTYSTTEPLGIGSLTCSFHPTVHGAPCYAVKVRSRNGKVLVYTGDTIYDEKLLPFISNSDLLITEASFYADQDASPYGHMTSREAALLAQRGNVRALLLSHLPHFGDHRQLLSEAKRYFDGETMLAASDLHIDL